MIWGQVGILGLASFLSAVRVLVLQHGGRLLLVVEVGQSVSPPGLLPGWERQLVQGHRCMVVVAEAALLAPGGPTSCRRGGAGGGPAGLGVSVVWLAMILVLGLGAGISATFAYIAVGWQILCQRNAQYLLFDQLDKCCEL